MQRRENGLRLAAFFSRRAFASCSMFAKADCSLNHNMSVQDGEEGLHVVTSEPDEGGGSGRRQAQLSDEHHIAGSSVSSSPGAKAAAMGAAAGRGGSPGTQPRPAAPSKFAQRIQQEREAAARAASGSATAGDRAAAAREARVAASMSFPPRPELAVEELSDEEVARWVLAT